MTPTIPTREPESITPGDTVKWTRSFENYKASDGWVLGYEFVNAAQRYVVTAATDGDDFLATISATVSSAYAPGDYAWRSRVSKDGEAYTVGTGRTTIRPSFASALETRSQARRALEAIEATLEGRASSATAEYQIAGRQIKYMTVMELRALRDMYRIDVNREDALTRSAAGLPNPGRIFVRHVGP